MKMIKMIVCFWLCGVTVICNQPLRRAMMLRCLVFEVGEAIERKSQYCYKIILFLSFTQPPGIDIDIDIRTQLHISLLSPLLSSLLFPSLHKSARQTVTR